MISTMVIIGITFLIIYKIFGETFASILLHGATSFVLSIIAFFAGGFLGMIPAEPVLFLGIWGLMTILVYFLTCMMER